MLDPRRSAIDDLTRCDRRAPSLGRVSDREHAFYELDGSLRGECLAPCQVALLDRLLARDERKGGEGARRQEGKAQHRRKDCQTALPAQLFTLTQLVVRKPGNPRQQLETGSRPAVLSWPDIRCEWFASASLEQCWR